MGSALFNYMYYYKKFIETNLFKNSDCYKIIAYVPLYVDFTVNFVASFLLLFCSMSLCIPRSLFRNKRFVLDEMFQNVCSTI